jgi:hypothetical protein
MRLDGALLPTVLSSWPRRRLKTPCTCAASAFRPWAPRLRKPAGQNSMHLYGVCLPLARHPRSRKPAGQNPMHVYGVCLPLPRHPRPRKPADQNPMHLYGACLPLPRHPCLRKPAG